MLKSILSALMCAIFVSGCHTCPPAPPAIQGPRMPALDKLPAAVLDQSFTETLQKRLPTKPSEQTSYDLVSKPATQLGTMPKN